MKRAYIPFILIVAALISCSKENDFSTGETEVSLYAVNEGDNEPESKTFFYNNQSGTVTSLKWNANQEIAVFDENGENQTKFTNSESEVNTTFTGNFQTGKTPTYAVFPTDAASGVAVNESKPTFTVTIPSTQKLSNVNSVGRESNVTVGTITGSEVSFKNICGLIQIYAPNAGIESITLSSENSYLAGKGTVAFDANGNPAFTPSSDTKELSKSVTITNMVHGAMYYMAVLPGTYKDLKLTVKYMEDTKRNTTKTDLVLPSTGTPFELTVTRGHIASLPVLPVADNVVDLDFTSTTNFLNLPESMSTGKKEMCEYDVPSGDSDGLADLKVKVGVSSYDSHPTNYVYWRDVNNHKTLFLYGYYAGIGIPAVIGAGTDDEKRLVLIKACHANGQGKSSRNIYYTTTAGEEHTSTSTMWTLMGENMTENYSLYSIPSSNTYDATTVYPEYVYLYGAYGSNNVAISDLTLYYSYSSNVYGYGTKN